MINKISPPPLASGRSNGSLSKRGERIKVFCFYAFHSTPWTLESLDPAFLFYISMVSLQ